MDLRRIIPTDITASAIAHLSLLTDDLPALHERLSAEGVAFVSAPVRVDAGPNAGGYGVYLRDPNGILIELFQPPAPEPS